MPDATDKPVSATNSPPMAGWVIANGQSDRYRCIDEIGLPDWTDDIQKAVWFVRREDADAFARGDEDAWHILPVFDATREDAKAVQQAVERRLVGAIIRHQYMGEGPHGTRFMVDVQDVLATYNEGRDSDPLDAPPIENPPVTDGWRRMTDEARALQRRHLGTDNGVYHALQWLCTKFGAPRTLKGD